jgi:nucleoid DNA-binding protein
MFLRILNPEGAGDKLRREKAKNRYEEDRSERNYISRGGASENVKMANIFSLLGIDYLSAKRPYELVSQICEGRRVDGFDPKALDFLERTYDIEQVKGSSGKPVLHFKERKDTKMSLLTKIAERTEMPRKEIKRLYDALIRQVHKDLREDRRSRLPELGVIHVKFRPARKAGKKPNPFKKGEMMKVKERKASNKLRFRISKDLRDYVDEKVEVKEPKSKSKSESE